MSNNEIEDIIFETDAFVEKETYNFTYDYGVWLKFIKNERERLKKEYEEYDKMGVSYDHRYIIDDECLELSKYVKHFMMAPVAMYEGTTIVAQSTKIPSFQEAKQLVMDHGDNLILYMFQKNENTGVINMRYNPMYCTPIDRKESNEAIS